MDQKTIENYAVIETVKAGESPPVGLNDNERQFYRWLLSHERGRLEQEYLPAVFVYEILGLWAATCALC